MKVDEIMYVTGGGVKLNNIDSSNETDIGSIDRYPFYKNNNTYYIVDDNTIIGAVQTYPLKTKIKNSSYLAIVGVFVKEKFRGKVLGSQMYNWIIHYEGKNLMSDNEQSIDGRKLWQTINKTHKVKVLNLQTDEIVSNNIEDAYNGNKNLVLVTDETLTESIVIPGFRKVKENE